tara:strand:+ start:2128 stop:2970 length:843 start_codon:yes stop_codon:yes gene_type:complete
MTSLYVISDTHDDLEAVARAVDFAESEGREGSRIIHLGDIALRPYTRAALEEFRASGDEAAFLEARRVHSEGVLTGLRSILEGSGLPYFVLPGNYDGDIEPVLNGAVLHRRTDRIGEARIIGYGGADEFPGHIRLLKSLGDITTYKPGEVARLIREEKPAIIALHKPPYGFCDVTRFGHSGEPMVTMALSPVVKLVLAGHVHDGMGVTRKGDTVIAHPGSLGRFELIGAETLETKKELDFGTFMRVDVEDDGTPTKVTHYSVKDESRLIGDVRMIAEASV